MATHAQSLKCDGPGKKEPSVPSVALTYNLCYYSSTHPVFACKHMAMHGVQHYNKRFMTTENHATHQNLSVAKRGVWIWPQYRVYQNGVNILKNDTN